MKICFITCFQSKNIKLEKDNFAGVLERCFDDFVLIICFIWQIVDQ